MWNSPFVHGELHSLHFVFIKRETLLSDAAVLNVFELADYRRVERIPPHGQYVVVANDDAWTMIADDLYYTIWNDDPWPKIERLATEHDVFTCIIGDSDESFSFAYFRNSQLVRRRVVEDPNFKGPKLTIDIGEPLHEEASALRNSDRRKGLLQIGASLGIKSAYSETEIRLYAPETITGWVSRFLANEKP